MNNKIYIFYDGNCVVCNSEINFYKKKKNSNLIDWIDISDFNFDASIYGLESFQFRKKLYAKKNDIFLEGVDTFVLIWETLDIFSFLTCLSKIKIFRKLMDLGYNFFTIIRPYLPKKNKCKDDYCEL
jgi:predicted DCC family thiol-disulfide oxidoreductase YuxK